MQDTSKIKLFLYWEGFYMRERRYRVIASL